MLYQVWPLVIFIDGFVISFCEVNFLRMFHSIGVFASPHSPSRNSDTCACGMQTISMDALFAPPCFTLGVHAKSMFENWDFVEFQTCIDYDLGIQPMLIRKMHLHYPILSLNNYYQVCNSCILSNTNCQNINPLAIISTCQILKPTLNMGSNLVIPAGHKIHPTWEKKPIMQYLHTKQNLQWKKKPIYVIHTYQMQTTLEKETRPCNTCMQP